MAIESTAARRRLGVHAEHEHYKWWALSCTSLGMLLATINSGTLIIALPDLERALGTSILSLVWVILAYMISSTVLVLFAGRLSDLFGRKRAYVLGFVRLRAGLAGRRLLGRRDRADPLARRCRGSAARSCSPTPRRWSPTPSRASSSGWRWAPTRWSRPIGLVIGPVLGGALVAISWHWVFWFNVPFALVGIVVGRVRPARAGAAGPRARLRRARRARVRGRPDRAGVRALARRASTAGATRWTIGGLVAGAVLLPVFVLIERRTGRRCSTCRSSSNRSVRRRHRRGVHQRALALRADVPVRLLLPGRQGPGSDHARASSSRRWRSGCSSPRRRRASGPTATARGRLAALGMASPPSRWRG